MQKLPSIDFFISSKEDEIILVWAANSTIIKYNSMKSRKRA